MDITDAIKRVQSSGARHGRGATEAQVRDAESRLGVDLPASYRRFLTTLGWAETDDFVVYGLGDDIPPLLDLVVNTDLERSDDPGSSMPPHLIPICPDGTGNHECLDTSREIQGDCPVAYWGRTPGRAYGSRPVAPSFAAWLESRFADAGPPASDAPRSGESRIASREAGSGRAGRPGDIEEPPIRASDPDESRRARLSADPQSGDLARGPEGTTRPLS